MGITTSNKAASRKAQCSVCGGSRNCYIRGQYGQWGGNEDYQWHTSWFLLECGGCEQVFVQTISTNSEQYQIIIGPDGQSHTEADENIEYWPAPTKRSKPAWLSDGTLALLEDLDPILGELYSALDSDLRTLSAIGIRTAFDTAAAVIGIDPDITFAAKLKELVDRKLVEPVEQSRLEILIDAGSASAHRGWRPTAEDLTTMMDVLEHFLHKAFVLPAQRKRLDADALKVKAKVPPRKGNKAKPKDEAKRPRDGY